MLEALAAKNAEIEALVNSMETVKKQAALSEGNLASLQVYALLWRMQVLHLTLATFYGFIYGIGIILQIWGV